MTAIPTRVIGGVLTAWAMAFGCAATLDSSTVMRSGATKLIASTDTKATLVSTSVSAQESSAQLSLSDAGASPDGAVVLVPGSSSTGADDAGVTVTTSCTSATDCNSREECEQLCVGGDALSCTTLALRYAANRAEKEVSLKVALQLGIADCKPNNGRACLAASLVLSRQLIKRGHPGEPGIDCATAAESLRYWELSCAYGCGTECYMLAQAYLCIQHDLVVPEIDMMKGKRLLSAACALGENRACTAMRAPPKQDQECVECYRRGCGCGQKSTPTSANSPPTLAVARQAGQQP